MKKIIVLIILAIVIIIGIVVAINLNQNVDKVIAKYDKSEIDGFEQNTGYIVSNKTVDGYRYGYVNYKGKVLLDVEYNKIYRIQDNKNDENIYLIASKNGRYGVSLNGKNVIPNEYQSIEYNNTNELFILKKGNKYGVADLKGKIIISIANTNVQINGLYIYIETPEEKYVTDKNGNRIEMDYNTAINATANENYFIKTIFENEKYVYKICDKNTNDILENGYSYLEYAFDDYFIASNEDGKQGLINSNGDIKIEFKYDLVQHVENTKVIRTLNLDTNETEIYNSNIEKIATMTNATIEVKDNRIEVYNEKEEIKFDLNGEND